MARRLIADDEAILALFLEEILSSYGHDVVGSASSIDEAVSLANDLLPDMVIMDISMARRSASGVYAGFHFR